MLKLFCSGLIVVDTLVLELELEMVLFLASILSSNRTYFVTMTPRKATMRMSGSNPFLDMGTIVSNMSLEEDEARRPEEPSSCPDPTELEPLELETKDRVPDCHRDNKWTRSSPADMMILTRCITGLGVCSLSKWKYSEFFLFLF